MRRREFLSALGSAVVWPVGTHAQQTGKVIPRVGWLILGSPAGATPDIFSYYDSFRAGLRELAMSNAKMFSWSRDRRRVGPTGCLA